MTTIPYADSNPATNRAKKSIRYFVRVDRTETGTGAAKLARLTGWAYSRCLQLFNGRGTPPTTDEVEQLAKRFGVPPVALFSPHPDLYISADPNEALQDEATFRDEECKAFGRELALALWNTGDDLEWQEHLLNYEFSMRQTSNFWDHEMQLRATKYAAMYLGMAIGKRYPIRDAFPIPEVKPWAHMIHSQVKVPHTDRWDAA